MKENLAKTLDSVISWGLVALAFAIPLFFLPTTSEFYEFNKQILLYVGVLVLLLMWTGRMVLEGKVRISRTPLDLPILVFLAVYILATIFSQDRFISLAGAQGRFHHGLISMIAYVLLYFIASSNLKSKGQVLKVIGALIASTTIASLVSILNYFGIFILPFDFSQTRAWTTLGVPNNLVYLQIITLPLVIGFLLRSPITNHQSPDRGSTSIVSRLLALIAAVIIALSITLINILGAWIGLGIGVLVLVLYWIKEGAKKIPASLALFLGIWVVIAIFVFLPWSKQNLLATFIQNKPAQTPIERVTYLPKEPMLPAWASWSVATKTVSEFPIFGSGPATFAYDFTRFKPFKLNLTALWDLRFDRPSSEVLNLLATIGIVGVLAYLFLILRLGFVGLSLFGKTSLSASPQSVGVLASLVAFVAGSIFLTTSTAPFLAFVLVLAALGFLGKEKDLPNFSDVHLKIVALREGAIKAVAPRVEIPGNPLGNALFLFSLIIAGVSAFLIFRYYSAEVYYKNALQALTTGQGNVAFDNLRFAAKSNPFRDAYHRTASTTTLSLAQALSQKEEQTDQDKANLQQLITIAINEAKITTGYRQNLVPGASPLNVANWEVLALIYQNLIGTANQADVHAQSALSRAANLDPMNARIYESLGILAFSQRDLEGSQRNLELAIQANPTYPGGHYVLAQILKQKEGTENLVVNQLELTLRTFDNVLPGRPRTYPEKDQIEKELEEAKKKLEEKQAAQPQQGQPPQQEPQEKPEATGEAE